jgi:hypothetical protein
VPSGVTLGLKVHEEIRYIQLDPEKNPRKGLFIGERTGKG